MKRIYSPAIKMLFALTAFLFSTIACAADVNALFHQSNDPVSGNPKGAITIVEFFDYNCQHCANVSSTIQSILSSNRNVRLIYKDLPILGPSSVLAARAALAANMQGKYTRFNLALFSANELSPSSVMEIAQKLNLNTDKFKKDMDSDNIASQIQANVDLSQELNIPGTPAFFVGKTNATNMDQLQYLAGEVSKSELQDAINNASK